MDAASALAEIERALQRVKLDAVLIGNAGAALRGAPVTTTDFDFLRPYYPASDLFRVMRDSDGLQLDFMATIHGIRSFEGLRDRSSVIESRVIWRY
jgi:hypothetical protein